LGQPVPRFEDPRLLRGGGRYQFGPSCGEATIAIFPLEGHRR
jgi:hypothetical protein